MDVFLLNAFQKIGRDHELMVHHNSSIYLHEYSYSITWYQRSSKKAEKTAASHSLKVLQDLDVIKVIDENTCDNQDQAENVK